jgi:phosphatidylglycerophosphate synthase
MVVLIISREFLVTAMRGFVEARGIAFPARWDGKLKMVMQCIAIPMVFLHRTVDLGWPGERGLYVAADWLAIFSVWSTFALTMVSGARYVSAAADVLRREGEGPAT